MTTDLLDLVGDLLEALGAISEAIDDIDLETSGPGIPPKVAPLKKAERHWPTASHRPDIAPAWPPFSGHRIPLGGDRR